MITRDINPFGKIQESHFSKKTHTNNICSKAVAEPQENKLKRLNSSVDEQFSKKRSKLTDENDFLSIVSGMLDQDYDLKIKAEADKQAEIEMMGQLYVPILKPKNDVEKAEEHNYLALGYQKKGKYAKALGEWKKLSKLPNGMKAFNNMGKLYLSGCEDVEKNIDAALRCFKNGANKGDKSADFNIALTYDNLRADAESDIEREDYREKAYIHYKKIANEKIDKNQPSNLLNRVAATFNIIYLSHLDKNGAFAPTDLEAAKYQYSRLYLKKPNDCRIPWVRAFVEFLINEKNNTCCYKKVYRWLKESASLGNTVATEILNTKNITDFKNRFIAHINAPQKAYAQYNLFTSNRL